MGNCLTKSKPSPHEHTPGSDIAATVNSAAVVPPPAKPLPISPSSTTHHPDSSAPVPSVEKAPSTIAPSSSPTPAKPSAHAPPTPSTPPSSPHSNPLPANPSNGRYQVFISHAGEDKMTIAIPLRKKLRERGITAFVDMEDMPFGTLAERAMTHAMETAPVGVFVMSPEFVARKWPMKELMHFLKRHQECQDSGIKGPTIIPFFYRLNVPELYDEPRLDRKDKQGNSLYEKSRFYERQRNGEAEANIAEIKATLARLHGVMGLENVVNADNDTSFKMSLTRELLLDKLCNKICEAVPESTLASSVTVHLTEEERDTFQAHFDKAQNLSELVFDFDRRDDDGNVCTQEGKVLQMLLDTSVSGNRSIAVVGMGGVGKTSLLRKIRSLDVVFERFEDGIYCIEAGKDATVAELRKGLISIVSKSGGIHMARHMRTEHDMPKVIEAFLSWFAGKRCLFVIDDIWETKALTLRTIRELRNLHASGQDSRTLLTTRNIDIATYSTLYSLKPLEPLGSESRAILHHYARLKPEEGQDEDKQAVDEILKRCAGLPLFLSVAGKAVKTLSYRLGHEGCMAYHFYADQLKASMSEMITKETESYEGLSARLKISIELVEERKGQFEFDACLNMAEMHRRLSVMKKQMRVPMRMLKHLWELEHDSEATRIAKEFEQVALADVEFERTERGIVEVLRLHDSVYEFAVYETKRNQEEEAGHKAIVEGYGKKLRTSGRVREWWSEDLDDDKYIHENVCRHLMRGGFEDELFRLLLSPKWLERQMKLNGVSSAEEDFSVGTEAARKWKEKGGEGKSDEIEEALEMIRESITLSTSYILNNRKELWFQVHGRLKRGGECNEWVRGYLWKIEKDAPKPGVLCMNRVLVEAGGVNTRIISVGNRVECMAWMKDGERIACGCGNGDIAIVNVRRSEMEARWRAHEKGVIAIDIGKEGALIVSGSRYKTVKVWDAQSGECVATFNGHSNLVTCVCLTKDGKRVVSGSTDGTVQVWEVESGQSVGSPIYLNFYVYCLAMFRDGEHAVLGGGWGGELELWNVKTNAKVGASFHGHTDVVECAVLTPDETRLVTGSKDRTIRLWNVETRQQIGDSFEGHNIYVQCIATNHDGRRVVSGSWDRTIRVWDIESGERFCDPLIGHTDNVSGVSFLGEGDTIFSCSWDGTVRVWTLNRKRKEKVFDKHGYYVRSVSFTPDGRFVVSGSLDGTLQVWNAMSGQTVGEPMENYSSVKRVAVTPNGQFVVSFSYDNEVRLWDLQTREIVRSFKGHTDDILCVAMTPDGEHSVTGSSDGTVRIWNIKLTAGRHTVLEGHSLSVMRVFVSDDGKRIFSVDWIGNIFVWDIEAQTGNKRTTEKGAHKMSRTQVLSLAGEATEQDEAGLSKLWDTNEIIHGEESEARVLGTLESEISDWDISPDKQTLCIGLKDGQVGFLKLLL